MTLPFVLPRPPGRPLRLLCIGAHPDDIEIGCGGTVLTLLEHDGDVHVDWVVFSATGRREEEARASATAFLEGAATSRVETFDFRDGYLPYQGAAVKEVFESLKDREPDAVFTHWREDRHQDHRLLSDLTWNTFRDHLVLEYEIPKYDGDLGRPNVFVDLSPEILDRKISLLLERFPSQADKRWFADETFRGLARLRGNEAPGPGRYAEAFFGRKLRVGLGLP